MSVLYTDKQAVLADIVTVEEAEGLLEWLQSHPEGKIDLSSCAHMHAANLQVLMAARPHIAAWPADTGLARWLQNALQAQETDLKD